MRCIEYNDRHSDLLLTGRGCVSNDMHTIALIKLVKRDSGLKKLRMYGGKSGILKVRVVVKIPSRRPVPTKVAESVGRVA